MDAERKYPFFRALYKWIIYRKPVCKEKSADAPTALLFVKRRAVLRCFLAQDSIAYRKPVRKEKSADAPTALLFVKRRAVLRCFLAQDSIILCKIHSGYFCLNHRLLCFLRDLWYASIGFNVYWRRCAVPALNGQTP